MIVCPFFNNEFYNVKVKIVKYAIYVCFIDTYKNKIQIEKIYKYVYNVYNMSIFPKTKCYLIYIYLFLPFYIIYLNIRGTQQIKINKQNCIKDVCYKIKSNYKLADSSLRHTIQLTPIIFN